MYPRSKLPTAARPGNLTHNVQGEGKRKKRKGHCSKDLRQTKKGKSTHAIQETAVVTACQALKACGDSVAGVGSVSSMTECITRDAEAGGL